MNIDMENEKIKQKVNIRRTFKIISRIVLVAASIMLIAASVQYLEPIVALP